jgi:D-beta-D-heptose 7-phosphate kinase/D-beta-D-heptose 1-phosphate adenosyltransferase
MLPKILVIGDFILDQTYHVEVNRISPEAPTITAELLEKYSSRTPGGAGFAAAWAAQHGYPTTFLGLLSDKLIAAMQRTYSLTSISIESIENPVSKTRFIEKHSGYHLLRLDNDRIADKKYPFVESIIEAVDTIPEIDACLLADYRKGFFSPHERVWSALLDYLASRKISTILDTRSENLSHWLKNDRLQKDTWLKLNRREAKRITDSLIGLGESPEALVEEGILNNFVLTLGEEGAKTIQRGEDSSLIIHSSEPAETNSSSAPDVTGCGDIFDVSFVAYLSRNNTEQALQYAVDVSSRYARIPFKDKLRCLQFKKD